MSRTYKEHRSSKYIVTTFITKYLTLVDLKLDIWYDLKKKLFKSYHAYNKLILIIY